MRGIGRINTRDLRNTQKNKIFNLNSTIPNNVPLVDPIQKNSTEMTEITKTYFGDKQGGSNQVNSLIFG
jgi:hypothetical protein